jgi:acetate kinase
VSALVLVINAGSSSLKYELLDPASGATHASGIVERIGESTSRARHSVHVGGERTDHERHDACADHGAAFELLHAAFEEHGPQLETADIVAVGHRVVHGGSRFSQPAVIDDEVEAAIERLIPLAPLHNPANLEGIRVARKRFPDLPQVAVFDTAFHQSLPSHAYTYAVPLAWREEHGVRRYGFHGTSHAYVSRRAAELLGRPVEETNVIVLHLGNGASATAVEGGRSVDTSMGLSPLEGLVMGTRPGDLDPSLPTHLARAGMSLTDYDRALNKESGLKGLAGTNDSREVTELARAGDANAQLALDVVAHRLRKYIGAYAAVLGRVDAVAFTAGIGEHSPETRSSALRGLGLLGIELDEAANEAAQSGEHRISADGSAVAVFVIPTAEELEIAREAATVVAAPA